MIQRRRRFCTFTKVPVHNSFSLGITGRLATRCFLQRHKLRHVATSCTVGLPRLTTVLRGLSRPRHIRIALRRRVPVFRVRRYIFYDFLSRNGSFHSYNHPYRGRGICLHSEANLSRLLGTSTNYHGAIFGTHTRAKTRFFSRVYSHNIHCFHVRIIRRSTTKARGLLRFCSRLLTKAVSKGTL